eukprot:CAMPEP_0194373366 /NCGR_PEP_ID=MMETSP0174-20130528/21795_1 /TAXON_ID=216777 /ORGANISM="Proboscia alata, Strain PI-D3" /LENGTH=395 /DNA_ID=CAMNT_0039152391 /DNA_START=309 /DNA_END=1494 /DNA_ORIENTATION=+
MNAAEDEEQSMVERARSCLSAKSLHNRMRPSLKRMMEIGAEEYVREKMELELEQENRNKRRSSIRTSSMTLEKMDMLLSSTLVELSSAETKRARHATYPIFKDNSDEMSRFSYLFDEIPFALEEDYKKRLAGKYDVIYHGEKNDWGALEGWELPSMRQNHRKGMITIGGMDNYPTCLEGNLLFFPESDTKEEEFMKDTFLHFDERSFVLGGDYKNASWYASGSEYGFGLTKPSRNLFDNEGGDTHNSVTLFRVNESMAFARGDKQTFISLEKPHNHGTECGSPHDKYGYCDVDDSPGNVRMNLIETMQSYRGSWISKLSTGVEIPDGVAHLIWEYFQTGPPPYLFVNKGDLLLLARCKESVPDLDFPEMISSAVTREHLVLARPKRENDDNLVES